MNNMNVDEKKLLVGSLITIILGALIMLTSWPLQTTWQGVIAIIGLVIFYLGFIYPYRRLGGSA